MKTLLLLLFTFSFSTYSFSQIDKSTGKARSIQGLGIPTENSDPSFLELSKNHSLSKKRGLLKNSTKLIDPDKPEEKPIKMTTDNGLLEFETEFNPSYVKDKKVKEEYSEDAYLGDFKTTGTSVDLFCRDHEFVDGDKVRILVNDQVVYNSVNLIGTYKGILLKLERGFNRIDIIALNQGSSGPNTAEFKLLDDKGKLLTSNEWNLTTGAKGTIIVVKE